MSQPTIRFEDGAVYERAMGAWSQLAGEVFLDWLAPPPGLRWIDIGCGNGAFTELLVRRCRPAETQALDPSEGQLKFARTRPGTEGVVFQQGDAMALPFENGRFDAATMALVIFFVPDPAKGMAEMVRVVRPGGLVAAYAWDIFGGGLPFDPIHAELSAMGIQAPLPPSAPISRMDALHAAWAQAGLERIESREITVQRSFPDFEEFWGASTGITTKDILAAMAPADVERLRAKVRLRLPADPSGRITYAARANAIKGNVPK